MVLNLLGPTAKAGAVSILLCVKCNLKYLTSQVSSLMGCPIALPISQKRKLKSSVINLIATGLWASRRQSQFNPGSALWTPAPGGLHEANRGHSWDQGHVLSPGSLTCPLPQGLQTSTSHPSLQRLKMFFSYYLTSLFLMKEGWP